MQLIDSINTIPGLGVDNNVDTVGIVMKTAEQLGFPGLGVFIPKFMLGYSLKSGDKAKDETVSISSSKCVNSSDNSCSIQSSAVLKNYIVVRPLLNQNQFMPEYVVGDKVIIKIIDNDIKTLLFYPYSINRLGQRATDKLIMLVPANKKENTALSEDNSYFIKLDSSNKLVEIIATNVNGETCKQTIQLDAGKGIITITDNNKLSWTMDTKKDTIISKTSGSSIQQSADVITIKGDTLNIEMDSEVNIKTDTENNEAETIKSKGSDVTYEYDNYEQTSDAGKFSIRDEQHEVTSVAFKGSTFHVDCPTNGFNGPVIESGYTIGACPNINSPVVPSAGQANSSLTSSDPAAMPLVKGPQLLSLLSIIGAGCASPYSDGGSAASSVASMGPQLLTTKIMGS